MKTEDYAAFEEILMQTAHTTVMPNGRDWRILVNVMFEELIEYDLEIVRRAFRAYRRVERFFPTLADIVRLIEGTADERASFAWGIVLRAVRLLGHYDSVRFPRPAYHYAIEHMGGWQSFCLRLVENELHFREKDFSRLFETGERLASWTSEPGKVQVVPWFPGVFECSNRFRGYALPDVLDAETCKALPGVRSEGDTPIILSELAKEMRA